MFVIKFCLLLLIITVSSSRTYNGDSKILDRSKRGLDFEQESEASAEYNYLTLLLSIIARGMRKFNNLAANFQTQVFDSAYDQFGAPSSSSNHRWNTEFPSAARSIAWGRLNPSWTGARNGYDAALNELPRLLETAINADGATYSGELLTLNDLGQRALNYRRHLDDASGGDQGHREMTEALANNFNRVHAIVMDATNDDDDYDELGRRKRSVARHVKDDITFTAKFFEDEQFGGASFDHTFQAGSKYRTCWNVPSGWSDRISSVNTGGGCVILYAFNDCKGLMNVLIVGSHNHNSLSHNGFNDETRLFRAC